MIETKCRGCGGKLEFSEKLAGQSVACPRRARQINTLGFLVFGVQVVAIVVFFILIFPTLHPSR